MTPGMPTDPFERLAVIGAGAWGTALALVARRAGRQVTVWAREAEVARAIATRHENQPFLPGVALDPAIRATSDLAAAVDGAQALLLVTPAQHLHMIAARLSPLVASGTPAVVCAKGIERMTGRLPSESVAAALPQAPLAVLSGPTFAAEVARGLPTAVTMAATDPVLGARLIASLGGTTFRPYLSTDLVGAQVGGAVKNVIAIACGIVVGRAMGDNARAALLTRGLAEIMRLGTALGARRETLMGLSGLGDLTLTCGSEQSRNMSLGIALGRGRTLAEALAGKRSVAEGIDSAAATQALAQRLGVEMPIVAAVDAILHRGADIDGAIAAVLARPFRSEEEGE